MVSLIKVMSFLKCSTSFSFRRYFNKSLEIPEIVSLGFGAELPRGALAVTLESDWMDRAANLMEDYGRSIRMILTPETYSLSSPERMLEHVLVLENATYRFLKVFPVWTRYWILTFRYTATSDEKREGILRMGINLNNGGILENYLPRMMEILMDKSHGTNDQIPEDVQASTSWKPQQVQNMLQQCLPGLIRHQLEPFLNSMRQRQERDLTRIYQYHQSLRDESIAKLAILEQKDSLTKRQTSDQKRHQQRLETIVREYQAKVRDVRQKYEMTVECSVEQVLELILPVQRFELMILRRKGKRRLFLDWNPLIRKLDQPPCDYGYHQGPQRAVCDDHLHLLVPEGNAPCPQCGKGYCRACHPHHCPKCKAA